MSKYKIGMDVANSEIVRIQNSLMEVNQQVLI